MLNALERERPRWATCSVSGCLWLELLTGKPAFGGSTYAEVKARFEQFPGVTPGHFSAFPQPVATLLAMMLAKAPRGGGAAIDLTRRRLSPQSSRAPPTRGARQARFRGQHR